MENAKITVVTVVKDAKDTIAECLKSVTEQNYPVRHLIVDGGSRDGTVEILKANQAVDFFSLPGSSIYEAMNYAVSLISNPEEFILFLNADDRLHDKNVCKQIALDSLGADVVYGRVLKVLPKTGTNFVKGKKVVLKDLNKGMTCPHQAIFARKSVFNKIGTFDTNYKITADYDWAVRLFQDEKIVKAFSDQRVSIFRADGAHSKNLNLTLRENTKVIFKHFSFLEALYGSTVVVVKALVFRAVYFKG